MEHDFQISHIPDPNKCVCGPGDVWACPRIYRFISKSENVGQTISDPGQKSIAYTLPSIWHYPFFQNSIQISVNRQKPQFLNLCYWIAYWISTFIFWTSTIPETHLVKSTYLLGQQKGLFVCLCLVCLCLLCLCLSCVVVVMPFVVKFLFV